MSRSAGAGSPVWFRCFMDRQTTRGTYHGPDSRITLTGRSKPYRAKKGHTLGSRSTYKTREYQCSCGYVGWSNHIDLARMAGEGKRDE